MVDSAINTLVLNLMTIVLTSLVTFVWFWNLEVFLRVLRRGYTSEFLLARSRETGLQTPMTFLHLIGSIASGGVTYCQECTGKSCNPATRVIKSVILSSWTFRDIFLRFFKLSHHLCELGYTGDFHHALATRQFSKKLRHHRKQKNVHGSIFPVAIPPFRLLPGQAHSSRPGGGVLLQAVLSLGVGGRKNRFISYPALTLHYMEDLVTTLLLVLLVTHHSQLTNERWNRKEKLRCYWSHDQM